MLILKISSDLKFLFNFENVERYSMPFNLLGQKKMGVIISLLVAESYFLQ